MENQGNSNKTEDDGYGKGSEDGQNKPKPCPYCSGTCQGADCSQFPSLQVGVRQARVPRRLRNAMIPELNESSVAASLSSHGKEHPSVNQVEGAEQASSVPSEPKKYDLFAPPVEKVEEFSVSTTPNTTLPPSVAASSSSDGTEHPLVNQVEGAEQPSSVLSEPKKYDLHAPPVEKVEELSVSTTPTTTLPPSVAASSSSDGTEHPSVNQVEGAEQPSSVLSEPKKYDLYAPPAKKVAELSVSTAPTTILPPSVAASSSSDDTEHPSVHQVEGAEQASLVPSEPKKYDLYAPPIEKLEELSVSTTPTTTLPPSVAASSSSDDTEHPSANQVEEAEQPSSVPSEPKKYDLYTPPVGKVEELSEKPAESKEMELHVDNPLSAMEELSNSQRPSSSSHRKRFLAVNKVDGKGRPSSLRPFSSPYVPLKNYLPASPIQDPAALVSTTPNTALPSSDSLGSTEKNFLSKEELEQYAHNAVQAELAKHLHPWYVSSPGSSLPSHDIMHPSFNQVEGAQVASPLPSEHPSLNQVDAAQAAIPLPSEHPSINEVEAALNQLEAAQAAISLQPELYYRLGPPVKIASTTPNQPDLYYGPGSPVKNDEVDVDNLNRLLEATFRKQPGTGYYSPHKPPLPRPPVRGRSSSHGARRSPWLPPLRLPPPPFRPLPFQVPETSLTTNRNTNLPTSNWTPQDVILPWGSTEERPMDREELRHTFGDVPSTSVSGRWFPASEKFPEKNDRGPY